MSEDTQKRIAELAKTVDAYFKADSDLDYKQAGDAARELLSLTAPPKRDRGTELARRLIEVREYRSGDQLRGYDLYVAGMFVGDCMTANWAVGDKPIADSCADAIRQEMGRVINAERADAARAMRDRIVRELNDRAKDRRASGIHGGADSLTAARMFIEAMEVES